MMKPLHTFFSALLLSISVLTPAYGADTDATAVPTSPVITSSRGILKPKDILSTSTSIPETVYRPGIYQVGTDLPAGEYMIFTLTNGIKGSYSILSDLSDEAQVLDHASFPYNSIVTLSEGQVLKLTRCSASPIAEVPQIDHFYGNMYKIGYHIPAGTYRLKRAKNSQAGVAFTLAWPSNTYDCVIDYMEVKDNAVITVHEGEYLQLEDCLLASTASAEDIKRYRIPTASETAIAEEEALKRQQTSPILVSGDLVAGLSTSTSKPETIYPADTYLVGSDLPAGEYVLLSTGEEPGVYMISDKADPDKHEDLIDYGGIQTDAIVAVKEGEYLTFENATASPIEEVPNLDYRSATEFKVGVHIPAGTWYFVTDDPDSTGIVFVMSATRRQYKDMLSMKYIDTTPVPITLEKGQYLLMMNCRFTAQTSSASGPGADLASGVNSAIQTLLDAIKQFGA